MNEKNLLFLGDVFEFLLEATSAGDGGKSLLVVGMKKNFLMSKREVNPLIGGQAWSIVSLSQFQASKKSILRGGGVSETRIWMWPRLRVSDQIFRNQQDSWQVFA